MGLGLGNLECYEGTGFGSLWLWRGLGHKMYNVGLRHDVESV